MIKHFEFLREKKRTPNLSVQVGPGRSRLSSGCPDYNVHTVHFLKHPKILVYDAK